MTHFEYLTKHSPIPRTAQQISDIADAHAIPSQWEGFKTWHYQDGTIVFVFDDATVAIVHGSEMIKFQG